MILLAGALRAELAPLLPRVRHRRRLGRYLLTGELDGHRVAVLRTGIGRAKAGERTRAALQRLDPVAVWSLGTCGSLLDELPIGAVVTADRVGVEGAESVAVQQLAGLPAVPLVTVDTVVWDPTRRQVLAEAGYAVCEMEAAAVLAASGERPFAALKVVSDLAGGDAPAKPGPIDIAAFQLKAARLCEQELLPALRQALSSP